MVEAILLIACFALFMYIGIRDYITRNERESHEWWLSEVKACIHSIEYEFREKCQIIVEEHLSQQQFNKYEYSVKINELEALYKKDLTEKIIAQKRGIRVTTLPDHLVREYNRNISIIADTFRYFGNKMSEQQSGKD